MDKKTEQSIKNYNRIAAKYDLTFDGKFTRNFKEELVNSIHLEDSHKILDVACGNGMLLKLLSDKARVDAYGVDISVNMIKEAKGRYPMMQFYVTNSAELPFEDSFFDTITVCAAFHHFTEPKKFISEAKRVLKTGGCIYIADPYLPPVLRQVANVFVPLLKMGDVKIYGRKELAGMFHEQGFSDVTFRRFSISGSIFTAIK